MSPPPNKLKAALLLCALAVAIAIRATGADDAPRDADTLLFANKEEINGTFLGCDKTWLRWRHAGSKETLRFQPAKLGEVMFGSHELPAGAIPPTHSVLLANGDELPGVLVALDDTTLVLDTPYAGKLAIPRRMVRGIRQWKGANTIIYQGPTTLREWSVNTDEDGKTCWTLRNGALVSRTLGGIWRDMKLPSRVSIEFDLYLRDAQMDVYFYANNSGEADDCYYFSLSKGDFEIVRYAHDGMRNLDGEPAQTDHALIEHDNLRLHTYIDREKKTIWLFVNGSLFKKCVDSGKFAASGTSLMFISQEGMHPRVSNITVREWDGTFDDPQDAARKPAKGDWIKMSNRDTITGKLKGIANGKVIFSGPSADLAIPLERVDRIDISTEERGTAKNNANAVRATFIEGGSVTMQIESWDTKQVTATSPDFGRAVFSPDAFQRLQFNP